MEIYSLIGHDNQIDMKILYGWENLYLVDICMYPHQVGVLIEYPGRENFFGLPNIQHELKKRILEQNNWDLVCIKYEDFVKNPKTVTNKMIEQLKEVHMTHTRNTRKPSKPMERKTTS